MTVRDATGAIDRLHVLDGGVAFRPDRSVYSPGIGEGEPIMLSCHADLLRRRDGRILWDTGIDDAVFDVAGGREIAHGLRGIVTRHLGDIGLMRADIDVVILSHAHFDRVGNAGLFSPRPDVFGYDPNLYEVLRRADLERVDGDRYLSGDGSVRIVSTPDHAARHRSLMVCLAKAGPILLSADVAHFRSNSDARRVPAFSSDADASRRSMDRVAALVRDEGTLLWLDHDIVGSTAIPKLPGFVE